MIGKERPDYGIDAPYVIRNLAIAGLGSWLLAAASWAGIIPRFLVLGGVRIAIAPSLFPAGTALGAAACWMYWSSRFGKTAERDKLIGRVDWRGDERVLDVGCGRGLILVGAARRLTSGKAVGIDIWQAEDLSGNSAAVPLKNAGAEGVADRVAVLTADMRRLPFVDRSFDVVVSRAAIHNLYAPADRAGAIREIARVLRPGGRAVIADIRHHGEYRRAFVEAGCRDVRLLDSRVASTLCAVLTMGSLRPNTMLARKAV